MKVTVHLGRIFAFEDYIVWQILYSGCSTMNQTWPSFKTFKHFSSWKDEERVFSGQWINGSFFCCEGGLVFAKNAWCASATRKEVTLCILLPGKNRSFLWHLYVVVSRNSFSHVVRRFVTWQANKREWTFAMERSWVIWQRAAWTIELQSKQCMTPGATVSFSMDI